jgi:hypothetical protein
MENLHMLNENVKTALLMNAVHSTVKLYYSNMAFNQYKCLALSFQYNIHTTLSYIKNAYFPLPGYFMA